MDHANYDDFLNRIDPENRSGSAPPVKLTDATDNTIISRVRNYPETETKTDARYVYISCKLLPRPPILIVGFRWFCVIKETVFGLKILFPPRIPPFLMASAKRA